MTIDEILIEVINDYVNSNGTLSEMDRGQLYNLVTAVYPMNQNSFLPADYCYNRINDSIDFEKHVHLFARTDEGKYLILGEDYPYSGPVYFRKKGQSEDSVSGVWMNGVYKSGVSIDEIIQLRLNDLFESLKTLFNPFPVDVIIADHSVKICSKEQFIFGVSVEVNVYKIYNISLGWASSTTYHCEKAADTTWYYYLDSIDECIGEFQRLISFETQQNNTVFKKNHMSELSQAINTVVFQQAFMKFIEQADINAVSNKAYGSRIPYGLKENTEYDGAYFNTHYGQGVPSFSPYICWWVVSIYYLPKDGSIILGIEEDRYSHMKEMKIKPLRYDQIGKKKKNVAVYYSTTTEMINYDVLYEKFLNVCEEVMRLGLN